MLALEIAKNEQVGALSKLRDENILLQPSSPPQSQSRALMEGTLQHISNVYDHYLKVYIEYEGARMLD